MKANMDFCDFTLLVTHKEGHRGDTTPQVCRESISISQFYLEFTGLPSTADLLFSLHLKIKPRASALALHTALFSGTHPYPCLYGEIYD